MNLRFRVPVALPALLVASLVLATTAPVRAQSAFKRLSLDMYMQWESLQDPQLSPDGQRIVYTRRWVDPMNDRFQSSLWIMNADGTRKRFLLDGSSARWSPDGTRIAFIAPGNPRGSQIHVRWMDDEGAVSQVTRVLESPSSIEWSPDGKSIKFEMLVPKALDSRWRVSLPGRPEGARWTADPIIEDRLVWRQDGSGWLPRGHQHVFVVSAEGGESRQITSGDWDHILARWMPDGRSIVFQSLRVPDAEYRFREGQIYSVDVASGAIRQLTNKRGSYGGHEGVGSGEGPVPSPDGRMLAFQGHEWMDHHYWEDEVYVMNADGSNVRIVARELGEAVSNITWAPDGSGVYLNAPTRGTQNVWFGPLNGEQRAVTTGQHMLRMTDMVGNIAVGTRTGPHEPGSLVLFDVRRPTEVRTLATTNESLLAGVQLGDVEEIWYRSLDDLNIQGWIVKPPDFDPARRYPLILQIHGCARGMYNFGFDFGAQEMAANGYVVLYTNPRGSGGYGSDFGNQTYHAFPSKDYDDLMTGVDTLIARGYVDDRNLFAQGSSGGGVLTSWIVGHTNRFRAAVARAAVTNWMSWVGTTAGAYWYYDLFEKAPWEDPTKHLELSPITYAGNVTTPTMLLTGELDLTTPMAQAEQFYRALKMRRIPTAMVRIADAYHGHTNPPSNFLRVQLYMRSWFERFMVKDQPTENRSGGLQSALLEPADELAATPPNAFASAARDNADDAAPGRTECVAGTW